MSSRTQLLVTWAVVYFAVTLLSAFLHQCGHGIGARVDGIHISTGVATAGNPGRRPSDPDYRAGLPVPGRLSSTGLLGPFVNWVLAALAAAALGRSRRKEAGLTALLLGAAAVGNAGIRLFPVCRFLAAVASGRLWLDDEATWGLAAAGDSSGFPTTFDRLATLSPEQIRLLTHSWATYFWPAVSSLICLAVLWASVPRLIAIFQPRLRSAGGVAAFVLIPFLVTPAIIAAAAWLDEWARLNW